MKKLLLLFIFSGIFFQMNAQLHPCGTIDYRSKWLKNYQENPNAFDTKSDEILYVPLTIHLLGSDAGTGYFSMRRLLDALCTLNEDFIETEMHFYIEGDINYIDNSAWNNHSTVIEGAEMMFENNIENTINCYFVADPAGNCGYNLPYAGMAVAKSCANADDHTWAHEMGHQLALPHPFLGWEGGISYDGSVSPNFSEPAPDTVLYDYTNFQDEFYTDTLIVDTAVVERVDGSNCTYAADGFCDTAPDYLAQRWTCNSDSESTQVQHDPNDESFKSDGTLIMSYADDACSYRFSEEQQAAMRANLIDEKPELLDDQTPGTPPGQAVLVFPIEDEPVDFESALLDWEDSPNATFYYVRIEILLGNSGIFLEDFITTESELLVNDILTEGTTYRWSVRPYNAYYHCEEYTAISTFTAEDLSEVNNIDDLQNFTLVPNLLRNGEQTLQLFVQSEKAHNWSWKLASLTGQVISGATLTERTSQINTQVNLPALQSGVYYFILENGEGTAAEKIVVTY